MRTDLLGRILSCGLILLACGAIVSSVAETNPPSERASKHVIQKGETVWGIAEKYHVKPAEIIELNNLREPYTIFPGQVLSIPESVTSLPAESERPSEASRRHVVEKGDTVWGIARKYNIEPDKIIEANKLKGPFLIFPGQVLVIPGLVSPEVREQEVAALCRLPRGVRPRQWRYIVIHHSGTPVGNAAIFDRYHRNRRMKNGLAYHFVIGNGKGSGDGEIEVGGRWTRQLQGGHCSSRTMNEVGIGICLVGDFEKSYPTRKQTENLTVLVRYLMRRYEIPKRRVIGHRDVGGDTKCPGRNFSLATFRRKL